MALACRFPLPLVSIELLFFGEKSCLREVECHAKDTGQSHKAEDYCHNHKTDICSV